jgi:hypothetical protein
MVEKHRKKSGLDQSGLHFKIPIKETVFLIFHGI